MAVCLAGTWRRFPQRPRAEEPRGFMGKKQVWCCDWCGFEADWSEVIEQTWPERELETDVFALLCAACDTARREAFVAVRERIRASAKKERPTP